MGTQFPILSARGLYAKPTVGADGMLAIQQNYARVGSDEIDRLYAEVIRELDRTRAVEMANQIDAQIWQLVHSLTLYQRPEMWVTKSGVANNGAFGFAEVIYEDIGWVKR
jgi:peptide/nickel transport system substrate-binding protein